MPAPDPLLNEDGPPDAAVLHREVAALIHRWQQAGVSLHDVAMVLATIGCQALGHAMGDIPPPEGPEIIQHLITHEFQRQAEACYFQHWRGDNSFP